ncbi:hypothetical protein [Fluviibacterium sp. S390]|uniref:hypothetical protein n=1 Tax=Fluviibacterium sp. S390 TaxID=3415139 RepID=UPI003C7BDF05
MRKSPAGPQDSKTPVPHATTTGTTGQGFYDANSAPQWRAIEAVLPWIDEAVADMPVPSGVTTLADFGCSEGRNSIAVMQRAVSACRARTVGPIQTLHSDLPTNDFSKLFLGLRPDGRSVFGDDAAFSAAVGGSMFDQLLPPQSVGLATTFNAIGFLSAKPVSALPGYLLPNGPSRQGGNGYVTEANQEVFARQAKDDVAAFLKARAAELVSGGKLLVQVFGCTDDARTCDGIYDVLNDAVLDHVASGEITQQTYEAYYQPVYFRQLQELLVPVQDKAFGVSDLYRLDRAEAYEVSVPFNDAFAQTGDLQVYARDYVNFFRAFTEAVLVQALPPTDGRAALVDRIYDRARERLVANKDQYPFRYAAIAMLLTRTA